ncbi:glycogen synthase GlgA [Oceaniglobus roseus]|uniref:glycogen synthase GlgA n=1 Tax=Oceaniglobus roseus TaxID=1737570 RepID=UPI000C7F3129|nr:glycogen synthase GlgA [Kandeliimicrobium roseum]
MIRVLSVASECAPLVKTGGLADVVGALPHALRKQDVEVRTVLPGYPAILAAVDWVDDVMHEDDLFGGRVEVFHARAAGLELLVVKADHLFGRDGAIYLNSEGADWSDNAERFACLSWMAARLAVEPHGGWQADIVHCHDWQAGLVPLYLRTLPGGGRVRTLITIHNIAFQGLAPVEKLERLRIPGWAFTPDGAEYWGKISPLKAGLVYADRLSTVSPTYALELMTPAFGMGLDGVIRERAADLCGILNGIDLDVWSPEHDGSIERYGAPEGKAANKAALRDLFGLPEGGGPLAVVISRLSEQKGLDLLIEALPSFLDAGGQLALLGSGDRALETRFRDLAETHAQVGVHIGYNEALSHRMMAGADAILVPSRFEPCGLTQLYGLRYGTVPVVALTGGLADTVIHANDAALKRGVATGLQFAPVTAEALKGALARLVELHAQPEVWRTLQTNAMSHPVGWESSAATYAALYQDMMAPA